MKRVLQWIPGPTVVTWLALVCIIIELILQGSDMGLWGTQRWRSLAYQYGAFWPGLLSNWRPNFGSQPWLMFLTYSFLHGGLVHLVVNMITMISLGSAVVTRVGQLRFLIIYTGSTILGGTLFALLTSTGPRPMVGASGALFGLAGALIVFNVMFTVKRRPGWKLLAVTILWPIGILVALNLLMYYGTGGSVAWETHLGGFLSGAAIAAMMRPEEDDTFEL